MKKMVSFATATILCFACVGAQMCVSAESEMNSVVTETFTYENGNLTLNGVEANLMVVAVYEREDGRPPSYTFVETDARGEVWNACDGTSMANCMDGKILDVGDLIYVDFKKCSIAEVIPGCIHPSETENPDEPSFAFAGSGTEIFGDEFSYIVRQKINAANKCLAEWDQWCGIDYQRGSGWFIDYGDVNDDGKVNVMDVINVNRNLMVGAPLTAYGMLAADVDKNGEVDAADSLNMLKSIVGLVDLSELG